MQQRPPIIFWLLLGATISLNLVLATWIRRTGRSDNLETLLIAFVFGQLNAVCICIIFSARPVIHRCLIGAAAVPLLALTIVGAESSLNYAESAAVVAAHCMTSLLLLGLQKLFLAYRSRRAAAAQFSMKHLFAITTAVALLAAIVSRSNLFRETWFFPSMLVLNNVLVGVVALAFWFCQWHWLKRLAATLSAAIIAGWCISFLRPHLSGALEVMNCIQALIVLLWLEWGEIIERPNAIADDASAITPAST